MDSKINVSKTHHFVLISVLLVSITLSRIYSYLLFHFLIELSTIIIGFSIFSFLWINKDRITQNFYLFIGISSLFASLMDLIHTLTYQGMTIIMVSTDIPTQIWIAARYLQSISIVLGLMHQKKKINPISLFFSYLLLTIIILCSILWWKIFPECFSAYDGLTSFKIVSEYIIIIIIHCALLLILKNITSFDKQIKRYLMLFLTFFILAEICFSLYKTDIYGIIIMFGHIFRFISAYFIMIIILEIGINAPQKTLYRQLQQREEELMQALKDVKILRGILPICASCKQIRDESGHWHQIDDYIHEQTEVDFTHGLCPHCEKKFTPE